mmetsp:Transcript_3944/g.5143  ORF Transcript_3944/g.5143 Transcript_3944/m.5143 type:complete len:701 (+) Transcript_3944:204-2306(+)
MFENKIINEGVRLPRDSMIAYIPLGVTADLGIAMRRTRAKRISQLKQLYPTLFVTRSKSSKKDNDEGDVAAIDGDDDDADVDDASQSGSQKSGASDDDSDHDNNSERRRQKQQKQLQDNNTGLIRREQFGSIVDYLEAKYAKGVMIDDLDEKIRQKKKQKKRKKDQQKGAGENDGGKDDNGNDNDKDDDDNMSILSDSAAGSCYSAESGNFIDDSELRTEVAHQILGSSAYGGKTKIEALSQRENNIEGVTTSGGGRTGQDNNSILDEDDHAFFVNVGDLEMEDGWTEHDLEEDDDWLNSMAKIKGKKRKRSTKDKDNNTSNDNLKVKKKAKKSLTKTSTMEDSKKKKKKIKSKSTTTSSDAKNTKSKSTASSDGKSKKSTSGESSDKKKSDGNNKSSKTSSSSNQKDKKSKSSKSQEKNEKGGTTGGNEGDDKNNEGGKSTSKKTSDDNKSKIDLAKRDCTNLKRRVNRLFKKCVDEIKKMNDENLPRKAKKGGKSKVSIIVPDGKKSGDKISFNNPHDPSQKLQVLIPNNVGVSDTFKVSVPMPAIKSTNAENKFSKECITVLDEYSTVFDEWCQAEAKYRDMLPTKKKGTEFKVGTERLKKYDQMIEEFPNNLQTPIDAPFLRKVVRRKRQNENKKLKLMEESGKKTEVVAEKDTSSVAEKTDTPTEKRERTIVNLMLPCRGTKFPEITFQMVDFGK